MFWKGVVLRVRALLFRRRMDEELKEELQSHIHMQAWKNRRSEPDPVEATRLARLQFGSLVCATEECREQRGISSIEIFAKDVHFAFRMLRKSPGFTTIALLTLALGIGANTAIFSVVNAVLLRPLPYADPSQLVLVSEAQPQAGISGLGMTYPTFTELQDVNHVFSAIAGLGGHALVLTGYGEPSEVSTVVVTSEFFSVLAAEPLLGRVFIPEDGFRGGSPQRKFMAQPIWGRRRHGGPFDHSRYASLHRDRRDAREFSYALPQSGKPGLDTASSGPAI